MFGRGKTPSAWLVLAAILSGCGPPPSSTTATSIFSKDAVQSDSSESMTPWPLTVSEAWLSCEAPGRVFVRTPDGRRFAVNGAASSQARLFIDIQANYDARPLIERGLRLCVEGVSELHLVNRTPVVNATAPAAPTYSTEPSLLGGLTANFTSDALVDGQRAQLSLSCDRSGAFVFMNLVRVPPSAPPQGGLSAQFQVDRAAPLHFDLTWTGDGAGWTLDDGDARRRHARLTRAILAGQRVTLTPPHRYTAGEAITWNIAGLGDRLADMRRACAEIDP